MNHNNRKNDEHKPIEIPSFMNNRNIDDSDNFIKDINYSLSKQVNNFYENDDAPIRKRRRKKKRMSKLIKVPLFFLLFLIVLGSLLMFTSGGKKFLIHMAGRYIYSNLEYQSTDKASNDSEEVGIIGSETDVMAPVINILLIGVEEIEGAQNTDSMIIATMNTEDHTLKLTSLMRDLYVQIPGYKDNKLNSAYPKGDIDLLYDTISLNFGIKVDGYCLVNFNAFQKIVDLIGGVEITLTSEEAEYLNTTNYISEKKNRNVVEGTQLMNGNQALGYCRVRKVSTGTENNDFGRTQRQRIVLQAIYDKLKSKNVINLIMLMNDILTQVKIETDIKQGEFNKYLEEAVSLHVKDIETFRIPSDGTFENASVPIGSRNVSVLKAKDWDATRNEIHEFIYGK